MAGDTSSDSRTYVHAENIERLVFLKASVAYFKWLLHATGTLFDHFDFLALFRWYIIHNIININNITMFRVIRLFVFVFGQIVHRTIRIRPNSLKPVFGTSLLVSDINADIDVDTLDNLEPHDKRHWSRVTVRNGSTSGEHFISINHCCFPWVFCTSMTKWITHILTTTSETLNHCPCRAHLYSHFQTYLMMMSWKFCNDISNSSGVSACVRGSIAGLTVWNSLPDKLRDPACGSDSFKQFPKTILFSLY